MSVARLISVLVLISCLSGTAPAQSIERIPAGFGSGEKALDKLIEFPDISTKLDKTFVCQGILKANGRLADGACYIVEPRDAPYVAAINKAAKKAQFTPARYNGKNVGVYYQYLVRFSRADDENRIRLYANHAYPENHDAYGDDYIAAQRVLTREIWQRVCPSRSRFVVLARAHVAYDGIISSIAITHGSGISISKQCEQAIVTTMENSIYMPAYADGESVPSSYLEAFGN